MIGDDIKDSFHHFLRAFCVGDTKELMAKSREYNINENTDMVALERDVEQIMDEWVGSGPKNGQMVSPEGYPISLGDVIGQVLFAFNKHKMVLRGDVASALLTLSISEGLILSLDPEFDVVKKSMPYFIRYRGIEAARGFVSGQTNVKNSHKVNLRELIQLAYLNSTDDAESL